MSETKRKPKSLADLLNQYQDNSNVVADLDKYYQEGSIKEISTKSIKDLPLFKEAKVGERQIAQAYFELVNNRRSQLILVRKVGDKYQLVLGRKYLYAALANKIQTLPCVEIKDDDYQVLIFLLRHARFHKERNIVELALICQELQKQYQMRSVDIQKVSALSHSQIVNMLRVLKLDSTILEALSADIISFGHAKAILSLEHGQQLPVFNLMIKEHYSVRDLEQLVRTQNNHDEIQEIVEAYRAKHPDCLIKQSKNGIQISFKNKEAKLDFLKKLP